MLPAVLGEKPVQVVLGELGRLLEVQSGGGGSGGSGLGLGLLLGLSLGLGLGGGSVLGGVEANKTGRVM